MAAAEHSDLAAQQQQPSSSSSLPAAAPPPDVAADVSAAQGHPIAAALQLMRAPSDEAKFAGLLLMVKHLNQQQQKQQQQNATAPPPDKKDVRALVLDAVDLKFLARLLASPMADPNSFQYKGVALAVVATLAQDTSLIPRLRPLCKHVLGVLDELTAMSGGGETQDQNKKLMEDCLFYLYSLALHDRSLACLEALSTHQAFAKVVIAMMHLRALRDIEEKDVCDAGKKQEDAEGTKATTQVSKKEEQIVRGNETSSSSNANNNHDAFTSLITETCATLREMLLLEGEFMGQQQWVVTDGGESLTMLAQILEEDPTDLKLHVLHLLSLLLSHGRGPHAAMWLKSTAGAGSAPQLLHSFGKYMRGALMQLLHGAFRETNRDPALAVLVHMLALFGQGWAVEEDNETQNPKGTAAGFFVHALTAETRMAAEELESLANVGEDVLATDASLQKRLRRAKEVLPLCLDGLDAVLRFLCGAGEGPECVVVVPIPTAQQQWEESFAGTILLNMRASLHDAVGALLKLLQDGGREWKQGMVDQESFASLHREAVRFLSAMLAEDEACMAATEALDVLPYVIHLAKERGAGLVLPWISRALSSATNDEIMLLQLVDDCHIHLWLVHHLNDPTCMAAEKQYIDVLLLLHELLLLGGASILCDDHTCLLALHPDILGLIPRLAHAAASSSSFSFRLRLYQVWFVLSLLWGRGERKNEEEIGAYAKEALPQVAPPGSKAHMVFVAAVGDVLLEGMDMTQRQSVTDNEDEEVKEELAGLWAQTIHLLSLASEDLRRSVLQSLMSKHGQQEVAALEEELLLGGTASAVLRGQH